MSRLKFLGISMLAIVVAAPLLSAPAAAQAGDVVRIGLVSPNTGANARYGAFAQRGARLAAQEINAAGGVNARRSKFSSATASVFRLKVSRQPSG